MLSAGEFLTAKASSSGSTVGGQATVSIEVQLKSSLESGAKFSVHLPSSVLYEQQSDPECSLDGQSSTSCLSVTRGEDSFGSYISVVEI